MKSGICPKCGSREVYCDSEHAMNRSGEHQMPITAMSFTPLDQYVCTSCGYLERYVSEAYAPRQERKLEKIRTRWRKVL